MSGHDINPYPHKTLLVIFFILFAPPRYLGEGRGLGGGRETGFRLKKSREEIKSSARQFGHTGLSLQGGGMGGTGDQPHSGQFNHTKITQPLSHTTINPPHNSYSVTQQLTTQQQQSFSNTSASHSATHQPATQ